MTSDIFLKIDGIDGESSDAKHAKEIEILSFNHGVSQATSATASSAGGGTTGRCSHADFSITKNLDLASPVLAQTCSTGKHIGTVVMTLCRSGGDKLPYMTYTLTDVVISSVSVTGGGAEVPVENVTFNYSKIEWEYTQQKRQGGGGGGKTTGSWNLKTNEV